MVDFNFGKRLKELRRKANLTQEQLATRLGISKSVVSYYELSERTPSPEILIKLVSIFHVSSDYLLGLSKQETIDVTGLTERERLAIEEMISIFKSSRNS